MKTLPSPVHPALAALFLLAGCVSQGAYPSLAPRPGEQVDLTEEPVRVPVAVPSDPALLRRVLALREQAQAGEQAFAAATGAAEAAVGRAGARDSESWTTAQQEVSRLEAARADTTRALADLDRLATERAQMATNEGDFAAVNEAVAAVQARAAEQQARIARLLARLSGR